MGSTSKRKSSDTLIIHKPIRGNGSGGGSISNDYIDLNKLCVASFDVKIDKNMRIKVGENLVIEKNNILLGNIIVGKLPPLKEKMIKECIKYGIIYKGKTMIDKNKILYGRFFRSE